MLVAGDDAQQIQPQPQQHRRIRGSCQPRPHLPGDAGGEGVQVTALPPYLPQLGRTDSPSPLGLSLAFPAPTDAHQTPLLHYRIP